MIRRFDDVAAPEQPVLVIALEGWIDAGFAAATAMASLRSQLDTQVLARFSGETLLDLRSRRPQMRISDGVRGEITWAEPELLVGSDHFGSGFVLLVGPEPDYGWRTFAGELSALALELKTRLVVGLGGFPTATPHTRPVRLAATASTTALAAKVGFIPGEIEVPTGIADVIGAECASAGIPSVGLWARVPHYVAGMAFAPAAVALLEGLTAISGLAIETGELRISAEAVRHRVDELIAQSGEHLSMVQRLEEQLDAGDELQGPIDETIPSGDEIAAELERYLRGEGQ